MYISCAQRFLNVSKCLPCVFSQLPLSSSHLDVYTGPGMKGPGIAMTSNSCPANLTIKRELSGVKNYVNILDVEQNYYNLLKLLKC